MQVLNRHDEILKNAFYFTQTGACPVLVLNQILESFARCVLKNQVAQVLVEKHFVSLNYILMVEFFQHLVLIETQLIGLQVIKLHDLYHIFVCYSVFSDLMT